MARHTLYEIDWQNETAFCTVCGYTEIYVPKTRTRSNPRAMCIARHNELDRDRRIQKYLPNQDVLPNSAPRHYLYQINEEKKTAVCAVCGPTDIRKIKWRGYTRFECMTRWRNYMRSYKRSHYVAKSTNPHALSQIDEERKTAVCAKCGPVEIEIWMGKKKINRRCINVKKELHEAKAALVEMEE